MREELRETLARLHQQLGGTSEMDEELRAELERTLEEIQGHLREEAPEAPETSLVDRLEALALRFEQSHPLIAETLGRTVRTLARMGI